MPRFEGRTHPDEELRHKKRRRAWVEDVEEEDESESTKKRTKPTEGHIIEEEPTKKYAIKVEEKIYTVGCHLVAS